MNYTLKLFNTGQVTLPKKWREKHNTKSFIAEETENGLLIKPILWDDVVYYEDKEWFWLYFTAWIEPQELISKIKSHIDG